ncbi:hypothetical protein [Undibacterium sp. WLX3042]|uniref:hypothetical protein n=1 Tax=Undibacterium sp. WLX3042 TaxID=3412686 RepID=UPI003C2D25D7
MDHSSCPNSIEVLPYHEQVGHIARQHSGQGLMHRYNWIRPHQFNQGLAPAVTEEKLNVVSGMG